MVDESTGSGCQKSFCGRSNFTVDVVLVATEERAIPVVHDIARGKEKRKSKDYLWL